MSECKCDRCVWCGGTHKYKQLWEQLKKEKGKYHDVMDLAEYMENLEGEKGI